MKTKETSTREQAIAWWNPLHILVKMKYSQNYFTRDDAINLTGKEIEEIWRKEINQITENVFSNPNQKQFQTFSPELFKKYIDKFSDEDKKKIFNILNEEFAYYSHEQMELIQKQYDQQVKFLQNKILELSK